MTEISFTLKKNIDLQKRNGKTVTGMFGMFSKIRKEVNVIKTNIYVKNNYEQANTIWQNYSYIPIMIYVMCMHIQKDVIFYTYYKLFISP